MYILVHDGGRRTADQPAAGDEGLGQGEGDSRGSEVSLPEVKRA